MYSILIVADEPERVDAQVDVLSANEGWTIYTAYSGTEALALLRYQPVDLITLELHIQVMDRFPLVNYVCRRFPTLPFIVLVTDDPVPPFDPPHPLTTMLRFPLEPSRYQATIQHLLTTASSYIDPAAITPALIEPFDTTLHQLADHQLDFSNGDYVSTLGSLQMPGLYGRKDVLMTTIQQTLNEAMNIDGAVGAALVDYQSGMSLGTAGGSSALNLEVGAAGNTDVVRAKMKVMEALGLQDSIEDILITLTTQYHLIRILRASEGLFLYLVLNKKQANLALARHKLAQLESTLTI